MNRVYKTIRRTVKNAEFALSFAFCMRMKKDTGYQLGLNTAEKLKMAKLLATPEFLIPDGAKITDIFGEAFFTSNYWYMWRSLFAFQPWHSAVEMKRYMHLFFHEMPHMNTMVALERTRYANFHSFILSALRFMRHARRVRSCRAAAGEPRKLPGPAQRAFSPDVETLAMVFGSLGAVLTLWQSEKAVDWR